MSASPASSAPWPIWPPVRRPDDGMDTVDPPPVHRRWTQGDITALRQALGAGDSIGRIAEKLGRDTDAVMLMMKRLHLRL